MTDQKSSATWPNDLENVEWNILHKLYTFPSKTHDELYFSCKHQELSTKKSLDLFGGIIWLNDVPKSGKKKAAEKDKAHNEWCWCYDPKPSSPLPAHEVSSNHWNTNFPPQTVSSCFLYIRIHNYIVPYSSRIYDSDIAFAWIWGANPLWLWYSSTKYAECFQIRILCVFFHIFRLEILTSTTTSQLNHLLVQKRHNFESSRAREPSSADICGWATDSQTEMGSLLEDFKGG